MKPFIIITLCLTLLQALSAYELQDSMQEGQGVADLDKELGGQAGALHFEDDPVKPAEDLRTETTFSKYSAADSDSPLKQSDDVAHLLQALSSARGELKADKDVGQIQLSKADLELIYVALSGQQAKEPSSEVEPTEKNGEDKRIIINSSPRSQGIQRNRPRSGLGSKRISAHSTLTKNATHLRVGVQTLSLPDSFFEPETDFLLRAEALLKGLRLYDFTGYEPYYWSNTSNCMHNFTNLTWTSFPMLLTYTQQDSKSLWEKYAMSTLWLQDVALGLYTCNDMTKNAYEKVVDTQKEFSYSWTMLTYGFLQNVLAQIISITNIYRSLEAAITKNDYDIQFYNIGRVIRILSDFDPIELEEPTDDWYYDQNGQINEPPTIDEEDTTTVTVESAMGGPSKADNIIDGVMQAVSQVSNYLLEELIWQPVVHHYRRSPGVGAISDEDVTATSTFDSLLSAGTMITDFIYGFFSGTAIIQGTISDECIELIQGYADEVRSIGEFVQSKIDPSSSIDSTTDDEFTLLPYLETVDQGIWLIYNINTVSVGCYDGGFKAFESLSEYTEWVQDPMLILVNVLYNGGFVYTIARDILYYFMNDTRSPIQSAYALGKGFGQVYYFLLISEYFAQIFETVNPDEMDYTSISSTNSEKPTVDTEDQESSSS